MGFFKNLANFIAKASIPTFKFENNQLQFKLKNDEYYEHDLDLYEIKTRHDSYIHEAYTLSSKNIFMEYIRLDSNASWSGHTLSLYEGFLKEKLEINELEVLESKEISNYLFKVYKIDNSFILHMIYVFTPVSDIIILDTKGKLYKNLLFRLDGKYLYNYDKEEKGDINFNISMVKENCLRSFFGSENN